MKGASAQFDFLIEHAARGERTALVTVTDVLGSASRSPGTHMAVSESGAWLGSLSGGCVEAAVVSEAIQVIERGTTELVRFGAGSQYIDIRLPCGGGIDLLILPDPPIDILVAARDALEARLPVGLTIGKRGGMRLNAAATAGWHGDEFTATHAPDLRLCIVGHGAETDALARLGLAYGAQISVLTPDRDLAQSIAAQGVEAHLLNTAATSPHLRADAYTAVVMLFHDHDWEPRLLAQALESDACYIGAMGSRRTHAARIDALKADGVPQARLDRLTGPIGLIPATRDPDTLALSVLAEVVAAGSRRENAEAKAGGPTKETVDAHNEQVKVPVS